ncbi:MAG: glycosyltransferase family 9 protein, partial [Desulfovibrio sp.]|nr:glycosyltransferase family 9 protein [Desulfovibrio sp.]
MTSDTILVLQMQRMGDLVLTFPLLGRLQAIFPGRPIWVVGEEAFFKPLMALSPGVTYFSYAAAPAMRRQRFHTVINLSHRPQAAALAGEVEAGRRIGPYADAAGRLLVEGDWQLYRASLTHNNRYNLFHWADLNCLDVATPYIMTATTWPAPRAVVPGSGARIGLFLGASEAEKHPDAAFWADLARTLLRRGHKPVLLGGAAEDALGKAVAGILRAPALNLCGRFSVATLARFLGELDLLVTPDTGPMHVAAWLGTPVLNLSVGPVNPWETGPFSPGHHVLRAGLNCAGCWRCTRKRYHCREEMTACKTASVLDGLLSGHGPAHPPPGLELLMTERDASGLYSLRPVEARDADGTPDARSARMAVSRFWQAWFGAVFGFLPEDKARTGAQVLRRDFPEEAGAMARAAANFALKLVKGHRQGDRVGGHSGEGLALAADSWRDAPASLRPFTGYVQMYAHNSVAGHDDAKRL